MRAYGCVCMCVCVCVFWTYPILKCVVVDLLVIFISKAKAVQPARARQQRKECTKKQHGMECVECVCCRVLPMDR